MHKRALFTTLLASLALAACGGGDDGASSGESTPTPDSAQLSGPLKISALNSDKEALTAAIDLFKKEHPDVKVTATWADPEQYQPALRTQLTGGQAADFMQIWPGAGNAAAISVLQPANLLEPLGEREWAGSIPEGLQPVLTVDGEPYGLAVTVSGIGAIFNDQAMEDIGAKPPTTFSEVLDLCQTAQDEGKVAFALGHQDNWTTQLTPYALAVEMLYAENPDFDRTEEYTTPHFANSEWQAIEDRYVEMKDAGCFQDDANGTDYNTSLKMVARGDALGTIQGNWAIAEATAVAKKGTSFSIHPVPASDDPEATRMAAAASGTYGVNAAAENKENALAFIDFLASAEGTNAFAEAQNGLPGIPNEQFKPGPGLEKLVEYVEADKTYPFMDQLWPNPEVQAAHLDGLQGVWDGGKTTKEVLEDMDAAWEQGAE